jgi:hypothetical protein
MDDIGFRVRLRVRFAKGLTTEATSLSVTVDQRAVTITSQIKDEPLNKAKWIILQSGGFETEEGAQHFGDHLRSILQVAALSSRLGVDVGHDKASGWINEDFARSTGLIKEHERVAPNIHGLAIVPDDDLTRFPIINMQGVVTAHPDQLTSAMTELGEDGEARVGLAANGVRLLNLALMTSEPLAQLVLAFSAIEELGQDRKWSEAQNTLIEHLAVTAEKSSDVPEAQRAEVVRAIRKGLFPLSLRQGVMRLLSENGVDHLRKEWDRLYGIRSGLFHGTARLSDGEVNQAAQDTIALCARIIFALIVKGGGSVPSIAETQFGSSI